jgi:hypothetical protein
MAKTRMTSCQRGYDYYQEDEDDFRLLKEATPPPARHDQDEDEGLEPATGAKVQTSLNRQGYVLLKPTWTCQMTRMRWDRSR